MKKRILLALVVVALLVVSVPAALAWQEGPGTDWWYIDANYEWWKDDGAPPVIEIDGNPAPGQTFNVGDTIAISSDMHGYAASCAGDGNGAYTEWLLEVAGPSGPDSTDGWNYDDSSGCAESDIATTLTINYTLTALGTHTVYMSSYAAVSQYWTDVADEFVDASLTFEVVPMQVDIDIKPLSDPNSINTKSKGVIPVAILTTPSFDATSVDGETVTFGLIGTEAHPVHDLSDPLVVADHQHDVDLDGDIDYVFHFRVTETGIASGATQACLDGETLGGLPMPIHGCDSVRVVK